MSRRAWVIGSLGAAGIVAAGAWALHAERRPVPSVNPVPAPYVPPYTAALCAAWLGDALVTTYTDGGEAAGTPDGARVRHVRGAAWARELPEERALVVVDGAAPGLAAEAALGLVVVTSPNPAAALLEPDGRGVWVPDAREGVIRALERVAVDGSPPTFARARLPRGPARVYAALGDGTFLVAGQLGGLTRERDGGGQAAMPAADDLRLSAPVSDDGRWLTLEDDGRWALAEVRWGEAPVIVQRHALPGRPARLRSDADGPVALVEERVEERVAEGPARLSLWWLYRDGAHTAALPWPVTDACLALRGPRVGVVAQGRAWALDRQTGATWTP